MAFERQPLLGSGFDSNHGYNLSDDSRTARSTVGGTPQRDGSGRAEGGDLEGDGGCDKPKKTPLPKKELSVLCLLRLSEPISYTAIYPFVNEMVASLGVPPDRVGYYAGLIESLFGLTQFVTVLWWGRMSDRIGRRPVILLGQAGVIASTVLFGFGKAFWWLVVARCLNGVAGEITDETNVAEAMAFLPLFAALGGIIGPFLGGFLPRPAENFPSVFKGVWLFEQYPYLLPCLAAASITFVGWIVAILALPETLMRKATPQSFIEAEADLRTTEEFGADALPTQQADLPEPPTLKQVLKDKIVFSVIFNYSFLALIAVAMDALWVLWLYTPIGHGGLGFRTTAIGTVLSFYGLLSVIVQLVVLPPLQRRLGTVPCYRVALPGYAVVALAAPVLTIFASRSNALTSMHGDEMPALYVSIFALTVLRGFSNTAFTATAILVNSAAPSKEALGTVNGLAQMSASLVRGLGPAAATSIFAYSTSHQILGGHLGWLSLAALGFVGCIASVWLKDGNIERKKEVESDGL